MKTQWQKTDQFKQSVVDEGLWRSSSQPTPFITF